MNIETKVVMLGTGTPNPVPERSGPSVAIIVGDQSYLIDAGVGLVRRAEEMHQKGIDPLEASHLDKVFLTHLHSDHTIGMTDLIYTPWVLERTNPLQVYGPQGTKNMVDHLLAAYELDIDARMNGLEQANKTGIIVNTTEVKEGVIYQDDLVTVEAFQVIHPPFDAFGYRFTTPDKTIVISGDTIPCDNLVTYAKDCDILIHEVFSSQGIKQRTPTWQHYHTHVHTSSLDLGEIAQKANAKKLVLYHQLFMRIPKEDGSVISEQDREQEMIAEIKENYTGEVLSAKDHDIIF